MIRKLIILLLIALSTTAYTQAYENAVTLKAGYSSGICFSHHLKRNKIAEAQALYNNHGFQVYALYKYQFSPYSRKQLYYYYGGGPFAGNWNEEKSIGIAALIGLEYFFRDLPIGMGLEWKPGLNIYANFDYAIPDISATFKISLN